MLWFGWGMMREPAWVVQRLESPTGGRTAFLKRVMYVSQYYQIELKQGIGSQRIFRSPPLEIDYKRDAQRLHVHHLRPPPQRLRALPLRPPHQREPVDLLIKVPDRRPELHPELGLHRVQLLHRRPRRLPVHHHVHPRVRLQTRNRGVQAREPVAQRTRQGPRRRGRLRRRLRRRFRRCFRRPCLRPCLRRLLPRPCLPRCFRWPLLHSILPRGLLRRLLRWPLLRRGLPCLLPPRLLRCHQRLRRRRLGRRRSRHRGHLLRHPARRIRHPLRRVRHRLRDPPRRARHRLRHFVRGPLPGLARPLRHLLRVTCRPRRLRFRGLARAIVGLVRASSCHGPRRISGRSTCQSRAVPGDSFTATRSPPPSPAHEHHRPRPPAPAKKPAIQRS